jgi:hypothetical protein
VITPTSDSVAEHVGLVNSTSTNSSAALSEDRVTTEATGGSAASSTTTVPNTAVPGTSLLKPASVPDVPAVAPTATSTEKTVAQRVRDFYQIHNPSKLESVDSILKAYAGREAQLLEKLKKQYNASSI